MPVSHARFLAQVNEAAAVRLIEDFQSKAKSLEQFPERTPGLIDPMITPGKYRKLLLEKPKVIHGLDCRKPSSSEGAARREADVFSLVG